MRMDDAQVKQNMASRLKRIEGQMRGLAAMVAEERDCQEIFQQLTAARSALQGASQVFLQAYASRCLLNLEETVDPVQRERILTDLIALIGKAG